MTREAILTRSRRRCVVEVPEWGGSVTIQELTIGSAHALTADRSEGRHVIALVMASVINEDGTPMFSPEDVEEVNRLDFAGCRRVAEAINEFNGFKPTAVEDAAKNSAPGQNGSSSSA
ncbi:MAG TPA: hypothetical protein VFD36_02425 [Kofleriaceae bacterium]|nr:hypothetical protein [Kofleriaceae bacterium]